MSPLKIKIISRFLYFKILGSDHLNMQLLFWVALLIKKIFIKKVLIRVAAKKSSSLNGRAIKASSLMAVGKLERWKKKGFKKVNFFLNGPALYPPPHLIAPPLREELFFCGFPYAEIQIIPLQITREKITKQTIAFFYAYTEILRPI